MKEEIDVNFLGIDLGTSSVKLIIMNEKGEILASVSKDYDISYPKVGWAEQNPNDWWNSTKAGIKELINNHNIKPETIDGISFSGQMHGLVILDSNNKVLMPAILWCDQRTQKQCDYLNKEFGQDKLSKYTGNVALTGFTFPKLLWVKENKLDIYAKIAHIMLPKDYISFKLTGIFASDVSDASGTIMFDVENRKWSKEILDLFEIKENVLPKVYESYEVIGNVSKKVSNETGLSTSTKVIAGAGDQAAGAVGTGTVNSGILSVALGTSGVVFASSEKFYVDNENRLHSFCHANGKWHQMGVILSAASSLKWWVDNVSGDIFEKLLSEAESSTVGSNKLFFLPYLIGERTPYNDPCAKGSFIGLNITHKRGDMTRAILEGVSFALRDSLEILRTLNVDMKEVRISGGGSKSKLWRQIIADVFNLNVSIINSKEGPAYGAAILAAVGCKLFNSVDEACEALIKTTDITEPIRENVEKYDKLYKIYSSLYTCLKDKFREIDNLSDIG
ncbi:xylulokinase [Clostridium carboxidivorans P7]|uniref:Xylulose kinase n=1 Tax=Clostridium carboxidivorans P7 TaxID=536227 RepID=C6PVJ1_9CLOT|nr:xylulokinase [Clostridium carboxidivorans]EET86756.1 xylulokinase [Clostridium carboxidivorans P7]EFG89379.1 xylulokinase [Clostridium carboxidivorans P7]